MIKKILKSLFVLLVIILSFAVIFVLTLQIFEYRPADETVLEIENNLDDLSSNYVVLDESIRILTFNTGYASLSETEDFAMDGGTKGRMDSEAEVSLNIDGISSILTNSNADIYLLQEVDVDSNRSYNTLQYSIYSELLSMSVTLGYNYRCIFVPFPFTFGQMMGSVNSGIVSFINYNVDEATRYQLPGSFSWPISLANLKRCIVVSRLAIADSDQFLIVINVHLSAYDDGTMRLQEMEALKEIMKDETDAGNYVIVGGDFNQTFPDAVEILPSIDNGIDSFSYNYYYELKDQDFWQAYPMEEDWFLENDFQFGIDLSTPSCRLLNKAYDTQNQESNQYYLIDGFIVSSNIEIESVETLNENFKYSDHNPVQIEIKLIP